jgi:tripartite-type tricarboxylate transporter receptor subunit TctC
MIRAGIFVAALLMGLHPAHAQTWPEKPIKLIVPTGAGAATDLMARVLAADVSKQIGGTIFVENIAGSSGIPAHQAAARAAPDGYTFLFSNTSGMALNSVAFRQLPYDPTKDFDPVAMVADLAPQMISVHKDVPVKTLPDLIAYVKANPGKVSYGVDATSGAAVFLGKMLNRRLGSEMAEVSYRMASQMIQDVLAGRLPVLVSSIAVAQPAVESGDLLQIALFSGRRMPNMPNVPPVSETIPGPGYDGWFVVVAPAKTPVATIDRMNRAIAEFLKGSDIQERFLKLGLATSGAGTPEQTRAFIARERQTWIDLAQELGVEAQ